MILVTVGMQLGFDRLIRAMDALAPELGIEIVAQTGQGTYEPRNMDARPRIAPAEFEQLVERSRLIVSHAGIGTILTAQRFAKPVVLFPRRFELGEHRNDHQLATTGNLAGRPGLLMAMDERELPQAIAQGLDMGPVDGALSPTARQLHDAIGHFIEHGRL